MHFARVCSRDGSFDGMRDAMRVVVVLQDIREGLHRASASRLVAAMGSMLGGCQPLQRLAWRRVTMPL
ncbi:hypothetical protein TU94_00055 [Streptomyces cyaneogriseus subsp. noncyanogenus]|uniref:Uncharacterized protein n=1 Tax=Streptomyces cyaneogriseus subsp. noncyanogenus TaxID=477245 RepID=A0A0C5FUS0_9ACTN|nr:hypothetical protein TU94_00055 [Streptomyces cyaneogriseus subsp. noncyanogenus]